MENNIIKYSKSELLDKFKGIDFEFVEKYINSLLSKFGIDKDEEGIQFIVNNPEGESLAEIDFELNNGFEIECHFKQAIYLIDIKALAVQSFKISYRKEKENSNISCEIEGLFFDNATRLEVEVKGDELCFFGYTNINSDFIKNIKNEVVESSMNLPQNFENKINSSSETDTGLQVFSFYMAGYFYNIISFNEFVFHICLGKSKFIYAEYKLIGEGDTGDDGNFFMKLLGLKELNLLIRKTDNFQLAEDFKQFLKNKQEQLNNQSKVTFVNESIFNSKHLNDANVAIGINIFNFEASTSNSLVKDVVDFLGLSHVVFYGLFSKNKQEFLLTIDEVGKDNSEYDPFYMRDITLKLKREAKSLAISGDLMLVFHIKSGDESIPKRYEVELFGEFNDKSISMGGSLRGDLQITERFTLKKIGVDFSLQKVGVRGKCLGLNGVVEVDTLHNKTLTFRGNVAVRHIQGPVVQPILLAAAITSNNSQIITLAELLYAATGYDTSGFFLMREFKVLDIPLNNKLPTKVYKHNPDKSYLAKDYVNALMPIESFKFDGGIEVISSDDSEFLITDKSHNIHYRMDKVGNLFLMTQFYVCKLEVKNGGVDFEPGIFACGQVEIFKTKAKFFYKSIVNKILVGAFTIDPISILNGLVEIKYYQRKENEKSAAELLLESGGSVTSLIYTDKTPNNERGPLAYYSFDYETKAVQFLLNGEIKLFWGFLSLGADILVDKIIDAEIRGKFLSVFDISAHLKADYKNFESGKFYLRIDVMVGPFSQKLNELSDSIRKKTKSLNDKLNNLKFTAESQDRRKREIEEELRKLDEQIRKANLIKKVGLKLKKFAVLAVYETVSLLKTGFNLLVEGAKIFANVTGDVAQKALQALSWLSDFVGNIISLDSFCLTIDTGLFNDAYKSGRKISFDAEIDFTLLGAKKIIKENLQIDFAEPNLSDQLLDLIANRGKKELSENKNISDLVDEQGKKIVDYAETEKNKEPEVDQRTRIIEEMPVSDNDDLDFDKIGEVVQKTNKRNIAMDKLCELLLENPYTYEMLFQKNNNLNDETYELMISTIASLEELSKDNYFISLREALSKKKSAFTQKLNDLERVQNKMGEGDGQKLKDIQQYFKILGDEVKKESEIYPIEINFNKNLKTVDDRKLIVNFFNYYYRYYSIDSEL